MMCTFRNGAFIGLYAFFSFILTIIAMMPIGVFRVLSGFPPISFEVCFFVVFLLFFLIIGFLTESTMYVLKRKGALN